jgi:hypothetical protein
MHKALSTQHKQQNNKSPPPPIGHSLPSCCSTDLTKNQNATKMGNNCSSTKSNTQAVVAATTEPVSVPPVTPANTQAQLDAQTADTTDTTTTTTTTTNTENEDQNNPPDATDTPNQDVCPSGWQIRQCRDVIVRLMDLSECRRCSVDQAEGAHGTAEWTAVRRAQQGTRHHATKGVRSHCSDLNGLSADWCSWAGGS